MARKFTTNKSTMAPAGLRNIFDRWLTALSRTMEVTTCPVTRHKKKTTHTTVPQSKSLLYVELQTLPNSPLEVYQRSWVWFSTTYFKLFVDSYHRKAFYGVIYHIYIYTARTPTLLLPRQGQTRSALKTIRVKWENQGIAARVTHQQSFR